MLGHVFVVDDAKDLAQIVRDATRYGGSYRPEVIGISCESFLGLMVPCRTCMNSFSDDLIGRRLRRRSTRPCTTLALKRIVSFARTYYTVHIFIRTAFPSNIVALSWKNLIDYERKMCEKRGAQPGFEPGIPCTQSKYPTTRPLGLGGAIWFFS